MNIADRIAGVRERIARAAARSGRSAESISLVAVSKTVGVERIRAAYDAGIRDFGENYYQEARDKRDSLPADIRWHFIGHLQTNKAKYVAGRFVLVHSVDSHRLAAELGARAQRLGATQDVLIEVKLDPAETKHGASPERLGELAAAVSQTPGLRLVGLMGMPPAGAPEESRPWFRRLREMFSGLPPESRQILSMGMSADFEVAIEEGATLVRVGAAIFGPRGG